MLRDGRLLHPGRGRQVFDRTWSLGEQTEELNAGAGRQSFHRVGDEVRGRRVERGEIDRVPLADEVIFAKKYMRLDACDLVCCWNKRCAPEWAHGRATTFRWKTNPEVRATPSSLALTS